MMDMLQAESKATWSC